MSRVFAAMAVLLGACQGNKADTTDDPVAIPDTEDTTDTGDPLTAAAEVSPEAVDAGVVCGEAAEEIVVSSVGDAVLSVESISVTGDWSIEADPTPWTLDPGEDGTIAVSGVGIGELSIETSAGNFVLPLSAEPDAEPVVTWVSPEDGHVLPIGQVSELVIEVADATSLSWTSDVDGVLATDTATDGSASLTWDPSVQSAGNHTITVTATDDCAETGADRGFCQQAGYTEDGLDLKTWEAVGSAYWDTKEEYLVLTTTGAFQGGGAFQTTEALSADNIDIQFQFYAGGSDGGADGMSLTVIDVDRMTTFVGGVGNGLGYAGLPGWSLELDTYCNGGIDATCEDHVAFIIDGDIYAAQHTTALSNIEDDQWHDARIVMDGNLLTVTIDGKVVLKDKVEGKTNFEGYVGFTAATGSYSNYHIIDGLQVTNYLCEE